MPSNHLILCHPLLLLLSVFLSIRVFSNELALPFGWLKYWSFSISSPNEYLGLIALLSKGPSGVFSSTTVQKHQFFSAQPSLWSLTFIHDYWKNHSFDYMNLCLQSDVSAICCYSVAQSYLPLWDPIDCSTPDFPVLPHLLEFVQTHVHWVDDAIQSSHPLSFLSPSALFFPLASGSFPVSQFFASGGQSIGASASTSVFPMNIQGLFLLGLIALISLQSKGP